MVDKLSQNKRLLLTLLLLIFALPITVRAQTATPTPTPRDALIQAIEARAQRDTELGRPPESIASLEILFGNEAEQIGLSMTELLTIYEDAYAAARTPNPWWADLAPKAGWIVAITSLILLAIGDKFKEYLSELIGGLIEKAYLRLAGYRPFWGFALRRYRQRLVAEYHKIKITFRPDRPLTMTEVYVPLEATDKGYEEMKDGHRRERIDAYAIIAQMRRLMVVGEPGAGKSLLLRHITLTYAQQGITGFPGQPIPILLELHRLNKGCKNLEEPLVDVLTTLDFPNAKHFVQANLKWGQLLLLLDGLDEVNPQQRPEVVQQIKDITTKYPECHVVVTCRTAVYQQELADWADQNLKLAPFSDQQIQKFLHPWQKDMPQDRSVAHLLQTLRERPLILALARNPLLLTIISYLYTDTPSFVIPHSRAEFYRDAVAQLLHQWKIERNRYSLGEKGTALQHLALYNQERPNGEQQGGRLIASIDVLAQIQSILPSLNRDSNEARPMLDEIVKRSGLLVPYGKEGDYYYFPHKTLQEYFAALDLKDKPDKLFDLYRQEPDIWRETVKLWCGLPHDSTKLLHAIYDIDPIMVFECLGDVHQANADFTTAVIAKFKELLGHQSDHTETIIRAFGVVAASQQRERGREVFAFLQATLENESEVPAKRLAAAQSLAWTNLPQAAALLAHHAPHQKEMLSLLIQMGDLAVPVLQEAATHGESWAQDGLTRIGTPAAALALTPLLWSADAQQQYDAAWRVGNLLANAGVEEALQQYPLTATQRNAEYLDWIWEPFQPEKNNPVRIIAGRVAFILDKASEKMPPPALTGKLDQRLVIPMTMVLVQNGRRFKSIRDDKEREQFFKEIESLPMQSPVGTFINYPKVLNKVCEDKSWQSWFHSLPQAIHVEVLKRLIANDVKATPNDWRNIYRPSNYEFKQSWQEKGIRLAFALLILLGITQLVIEIIAQGTLGQWTSSYLLPIIMLIAAFILVKNRLALDNILTFLAIGALFLGSSISVVVAQIGQPTGAVIAVNALAFAIIGALAGFLVDEGMGGIMVGAIIGAAVGTGTGIATPWLLTVFSGGAVVTSINGAVIGAIIGILFGILIDLSSTIIGLGVGAIFGGIAILLPMLFTVPPTQLLLNYGGVTAVFLFWPLWLMWIIVLYRQGKRQERLAQNPLQGLLEGDTRFYRWRSQPVSSIGRFLPWVGRGRR